MAKKTDMKKMTLPLLRSKEGKYRASLREQILQHHAAYLKSAQTQVMQHSDVLRRGGTIPPAGARTIEDIVKYLWGDAIWCGDVHILWCEDFYEAEAPEYTVGTPSADMHNWMEKVFDEVFKATLPEVYHSALEG